MPMGPEEWTKVDDYLERALLPPDPVLEEALASSRAAGLPEIQVTPLQGRYLEVLARAVGARRILEIGTLGGYSTTWLARTLPPDGELVSLELDPNHAEVARRNLEDAGLAARVSIRVARASQSLAQLARERAAPFDLVFIDADKESVAEYFDRAVELTRPGGIILVDNVVREGAILTREHPDPRVLSTRRFLDAVGRDPRVRLAVLQTVGRKKWDGMAIAVVLGPRSDERVSEGVK